MSQKIVFMGTPEFSVPTLETLINSNHKVLGVLKLKENFFAKIPTFESINF